jgi:chemotaxis regulatin CheY-phosphate phosphatase CheZ
MDAPDFFRDVVKPNYDRFLDDQNQLRRLWNAVVSMNTVAEYVALDRLRYKQVAREQLDQKAKEIRRDNQVLLELKDCAETLKHVRKLAGKVGTEVTSVPSSTGILSNQPTTWVIDYQLRQYVLSDVLRRAFYTLSTFSEFNQ